MNTTRSWTRALVLALSAGTVWLLPGRVAFAQDPVEPPAAATAAAPTAAPAEPPGQATSPAAAPVTPGPAAPSASPRALWSEVFVPMWQRLASALPVVLKAVLLLLIFWIVAIIAGAGVRRLLSLTRLDNRLVRELGLETLLRKESGEVRSIETLAGSFVSGSSWRSASWPSSKRSS